MSVATSPIYVSADVKRLGTAPFIPNAALRLTSVAGTTLYSAERTVAQDSTNFQKFVGDGLTKAFYVTGFTAAVTTGGAVSAANQLLTVATVDGTPKLRARGDAAVAAATQFITTSGGGTAIGQTDLTLKATTAVAVGDTTIYVKEASGTNTIIVGDQVVLSGDTTVYTVTSATATLDATGVAITITPPIKVAVASGSSNATTVTVTAPAKPIALFYTAPALNSVVKVYNYAAGDITTVTGGALTAGRVYQEKLGRFIHSAGNVSIWL